jgi:hypothetical protein
MARVLDADKADLGVLDDFENIPQEYDMQYNHTVPGGLKSIMVTPFGRQLVQPL